MKACSAPVWSFLPSHLVKCAHIQSLLISIFSKTEVCSLHLKISTLVMCEDAGFLSCITVVGIELLLQGHHEHPGLDLIKDNRYFLHACLFNQGICNTIYYLKIVLYRHSWTRSASEGRYTSPMNERYCVRGKQADLSYTVWLRNSNPASCAWLCLSGLAQLVALDVWCSNVIALLLGALQQKYVYVQDHLLNDLHVQRFLYFSFIALAFVKVITLCQFAVSRI